MEFSNSETGEKKRSNVGLIGCRRIEDSLNETSCAPSSFCVFLTNMLRHGLDEMEMDLSQSVLQVITQGRDVPTVVQHAHTLSLKIGALFLEYAVRISTKVSFSRSTAFVAAVFCPPEQGVSVQRKAALGWRGSGARERSVYVWMGPSVRGSFG